MITKPTLLILGAGASIPYGFPSGEDLKAGVLRAIEDYGTRRIIDEYSSAGATTGDLKEAIQDSHLASVDLILESQPKLVKIGKAAMVIPIMQAEDETALRGDAGKDHWYQHLFRKMHCANHAEFSENQLRIATFNYDRSIEQFLLSAVRQTYGLPNKVASDIVRHVPICHLHGSLGPLPPLNPEGKRGYKKSVSTEEVFECAKNVKIISESRDLEEFREVRGWLDWAEQVVFLGFQYHPTNLERLDPGAFIERRKRSPFRVFGSFYGMTNLERQTAVKKLDGMLECDGAVGALENMKSLNFLREHISFE